MHGTLLCHYKGKILVVNISKKRKVSEIKLQDLAKHQVLEMVLEIVSSTAFTGQLRQKRLV